VTGTAEVKLIALSVAAGVALMLGLAGGLIAWRYRRENVTSSNGTMLSRTTLLELGSSSEHDLTFELTKSGDPIQLGKGTFGEVRLHVQPC
jgi:hypothetical protein